MKRLNYFFLFLLLIPFTSFNQEDDNWCGSDEILQRHIDENPNYLEELSQRVQEIREIAQSKSGSRDTKYIIPVVFHVIHDGGPGNISMEQIQSGIDVMNEDFNAYNADRVDIRNTTNAPFLDVQGNVEVEFRLAKLDPQGNCTNGVQRRYAPHLTNEAGEACKYNSNGGLSAWPNNKYINIWLVNSIAGSGGGTTLGYAFLPYNTWGAGHGILNRHDRVGRVGTAATNGGRTLTHEMGHICGLLHTFQNGCHSNNCASNGDFVCDTPPAVQEFACNPSLNTCTEVPVGDYYGIDVLDQIENHMSYNNCRRMFSEGQKNLMHNVFDGVGNFASITSPENLEATGVTLPDVICKADFSSPFPASCVGSPISFKDESYHGPIAWKWEFSGPETLTSDLQDPEISFTIPGRYNVKLSVTDGVDTVTTLKEDYVFVMENLGYPPFVEGFEDYSDIGSSLWTNPSDEGIITFEIVDGVAASGNKSLGIQNFNLVVGTINEVISSPFDLSRVEEGGSITMSFKHAYRKRASTNNDWLRVYFSGNCGESWSLVASRRGNQLNSQIETSSWQPAGAEDWVDYQFTNSNGGLFTEDFRVKFELISDGGNNLFIDDINIFTDDLIEGPFFKVSGNEGCVNTSTFVFTDASIAVDSWMWDFGVDASPATATGVGPHEVTYSSSGEKEIVLTSGSGDIHQEVVYVDECLSISQNSLSAFNLYPNPTSGSFSVIAMETIAAVRVIDAMGRLVHAKEAGLGQKEVQIDLSSYPAGVYMVEVTSGQTVNYKRVVLNK